MALPFLVLFVSLALTAFAWQWLRVREVRSATAQFEREARRSAAELRERIVAFEEVLQAGAGLIVASDTVSRDEWRRFIERLDLPHAYPGIEAVNYAERLTPSALPSLVARVRSQGDDQFHVWPEGDRDEYVANVLVEPFGGVDRHALGFDLLSEPTRRHALEVARDTGTVSIASLATREQLVLDRSPAPRPALLMIVAVYRHDSAADTLEERRRALVGYVTAAFHLDEVVSSILNTQLMRLGIEIAEGRQFAPAKVIFSRAFPEDAQEQLATLVPLTLSDQSWSLRFTTPRRQAVALQGDRSLLALAAGLPLSLVLFGITWSEARLRARATALAREMTRTAREQAELLDLTHDSVFLCDRANIIRYWNRAASDTYGFSAEEAIGRSADELLRTRHPEPPEAIWERLSKDDHWEGEAVHMRRDGSEIVVASRWVARRGADGAIESVLETNNDITERRRAEEDRRRLEASLLQAQKLEAMGTLAGGVAHDFNNILGAILGYGELAQGASAPGSPLRRYVDNVMAAGQRAKSLVERILAFSRSGVGPRTVVHIQSVVAETLELLGASLPDNIRVESELRAADAAIIGDATQIHQVVLNLCTNAAQAMTSGGTLGVRLEVVHNDAPLTVLTSTLPADTYVRLEVLDTGVGIDAELQNRIFDPFFTTKGVGVGTGLGLSLVHNTVIELGGGIDMTSELNRGTTFRVYLPHRGRAQPERAAEEAPITGNGETIMIVDDEESLVRLAEEVLAALGYEPVGFTSPAAALDAFRRDPERFAAVLSDETMPGMTGTQLTEQIIATRARTPVVLMSGYPGPALAAHAHLVGARDVLSKPLDSQTIGRALAAALGKR